MGYIATVGVIRSGQEFSPDLGSLDALMIDESDNRAVQ